MNILIPAIGKESLYTKFKSNENCNLQNPYLQNKQLKEDVFIKQQRALNFTSASPKVTEMSNYITNLNAYQELERLHAGWEKAVDNIITIVSNNFKKSNILEHGPGMGNSTKEFALRIPNSKIDAVEIDFECYEKLVSNMSKYKNVTPINESSLDYQPNEKCDAVLAMFSLTHLNEFKMNEFLARCRDKILKENGLIVIGEEILPPHNINDAQSRLKALLKHHGNVIAKAIYDGQLELAKLELEAAYSGFHRLGDFKVHAKLLEKRLKDAGFKIIEKNKIYPQKNDFALSRDPNTGVYVYAAKLR